MNVPEKRNPTYEIKNEIKERLNGRFVISYCGGVSKSRNIEEIIDAFHKASKPENSILLLAGSISDSYKIELQKKLDDLGISPADYLISGQVSNEEIFSFMALSHITFALYDATSLNNRMSSPNKIFDALHAKVYVIASYSPLVDTIINESKLGKTVKDKSDLETALNQAIVDVEDYGTKAIEEIVSKYSWSQEFARVKPSLIKVFK